MTAPYIPFNNVLKAAVEIVLAGQHLINAYHLLKGSAWDAASMVDAKDAIGNWLTDNLKGTVSEDLTWTGAFLTDLTTESSPSFFSAFTAPIVGTKDGPSVPTGTAGVISLHTPNRGRSYRGRSYLPGIAQSDQVDEATFATALATAIAASYSVLNLYVGPDTGSVHVVPSRQNGGVLRTTGVATGIAGYSMDTAFDSQRRRLQGRGT